MNIKRKFLQLVSACEKDEELFDFIEMGMNAMVNYVGKVAHMEYCIPLYNARYDGQEFRNKVQELDERRRMAHESAISAVNSLMRLAKNLGVEPMFDAIQKIVIKLLIFVKKWFTSFSLIVPVYQHISWKNTSKLPILLLNDNH